MHSSMERTCCTVELSMNRTASRLDSGGGRGTRTPRIMARQRRTRTAIAHRPGGRLGGRHAQPHGAKLRVLERQDEAAHAALHDVDSRSPLRWAPRAGTHRWYPTEAHSRANPRGPGSEPRSSARPILQCGLASVWVGLPGPEALRIVVPDDRQYPVDGDGVLR